MEGRSQDWAILRTATHLPAGLALFSQCLDTRWPAGMDHGQLAIALGVEALLGDGFGAELAFDRGWGAHDQGSWRHILGDYGACGHQGPGAHGDAVEDHRADANQAAILEAGSMDDCSVANGDIGSNHHRLTWIAMQHGPVLHIGALSHPDRAEIAPCHGQGPEAGPGGKVHIPNHHGGACHPGVAVDLGFRPGKGAHVDGDHGPILKAMARGL